MTCLAGSPPRSRRVLWIALAVLLFYASQLDTRLNLSRDSVLYLGLGESIQRGEGMTFNGRSLAGLSPGLPLQWAALVSLAGRSYLLGRGVSILWALATVGLGWLLIRRLGGRWTAAIALPLLACNPRIFKQAGFILTDLPFTCLLTATLLCCLLAMRGRAAWALLGGFAFAAAAMYRLVGGVVLPFLLLGVLLDGSSRANLRRRVSVAALMVLVVVPVMVLWGSYASSQPENGGMYVESARSRFAWETLSARVWMAVENLWRLPKFLFDLFLSQRPDWFVWIFLLVPLGVGVGRSIRLRQWLILLPAGGYFLFLCFWDPTSVYARYLLPMVVPLCLWMAVGLWAVGGWLCGLTRRGLRCRRTLAWVLVCSIAVAGIVPKVYYALRYRFTDLPWQVRLPREVELARLTGWVRRHTEPEETILAREDRVIHYATGRRVHYLGPRSGEGDEVLYRRVASIAAGADWLIVYEPSVSQDPVQQALRRWVEENRPRLQRRGRDFGATIYRQEPGGSSSSGQDGSGDSPERS